MPRGLVTRTTQDRVQPKRQKAGNDAESQRTKNDNAMMDMCFTALQVETRRACGEENRGGRWVESKDHTRPKGKRRTVLGGRGKGEEEGE